MKNIELFKKFKRWLLRRISPSNFKLGYEPQLIPPPYMMKQEGIETLEEWFRWAEEWSMILRIYGKMTKYSSVLEIGCGLGRIAFPLRYALLDGSYEGLEIRKNKVNFLQKKFHSAYPNFKFTWANIKNTHFNPNGDIEAVDYCFPYANNEFDVVFAASVFTHMVPQNAANYFKESARVLKRNGRCIFSFFILDYYEKGRPRPLGFSSPYFNFDYHHDKYKNDFAINDPDDPEKLTAYSSRLIENLAEGADLKFIESPLPGIWSGSTDNWVGAQDLIILKKNR
jgi:SAM-dependent methyltransferase